MKDFLLGLADHVYRTVSGSLGRLQNRRIHGYSAAGDAQFDVDALAENAVREYLERQGVPVALSTEDSDLIEIGNSPELMLIVDPIDGSRSAAAGLESCCISIAAAGYSRTARLRDVEYALLKELKSGAFLYGERKSGGLVAEGYPGPVPNLSTRSDLDRMYWSLEFNGHPADLMIEAYGHLIDRSANRGGVFVFSSACFSLSRLLTGQLDAYVDIGNRLLRDRPELLPRFQAVGNGGVLHLFPYDIAAAVFLAEKGGAVVTDAYGRPLGDTLLLDKSLDNQQSCIAAANEALHAALLSSIRWS